MGLVFGSLCIVLTATGFAQLPGEPTFPVTVEAQEQTFESTFPMDIPGEPKTHEHAQDRLNQLKQWWNDQFLPFLKNIENFDVAVGDFDKKVELMKSQGTITPEQYQTWEGDQSKARQLTRSDGPLLQLRTKWSDQYYEAKGKWASVLKNS
jgi:hypothetical protein